MIVVSELAKGPLPSISVILDQALQHGDGDRLAISKIESDVTQEWRNTSEMGGLGEKSADLRIWIFAGLQAPKKLHDELAAVENRSVGLLSRSGT